MNTKKTLSLVFACCVVAIFTPVDAHAAVTNFTCMPISIASNQNLVHIECSVAQFGIRYFAVPYSASAEANRLVSLGVSALVSGKSIGIMYDTTDTTTGPSFGCAASNCRRVISIAILSY